MNIYISLLKLYFKVNRGDISRNFSCRSVFLIGYQLLTLNNRKL